MKGLARGGECVLAWVGDDWGKHVAEYCVALLRIAVSVVAD